MAVFVSNIVIEQGFDFNTTFELEDTLTTDPLVLTGYTVEAQIRKTYSSTSAVNFACTIITPPTDGKVQISLTDTETANLKEGRYVYDLKATNTNGKVLKLIEGAALVRPGVTR
jgi:hypothetical protein